EVLDVTPLRAATYLRDGTLLAVGEGGHILRLRGSEVLDRLRPYNVDLLATRVIGDEIAAVGAGAWAFRLSVNPLAAELESVETLSALTCLADAGTELWAGSSKGRLLRRRNRHWRRMNQTIDGDPGVIAI